MYTKIRTDSYKVNSTFKDSYRELSDKSNISRHFYSRHETEMRGVLELRKRIAVIKLDNVSANYPSTIGKASNLSFIKFLQYHGAQKFLDTFCDRVHVVQHSKFPNLLYFTSKEYVPCAIERDKSDIIAECCGVLVDMLDFHIINAHSNMIYSSWTDTHSSSHLEEIVAWTGQRKCLIYEEFDGLLVSLYFCSDSWYLSTRCTIIYSIIINTSKGKVTRLVWWFAGNNLITKWFDNSRNDDQHKSTIESLFWYIWNKSGYKLPSDNYTKYSYEFQLITNHHRILVNHTEFHEKLILHAVFDLVNEYLSSIHLHIASNIWLAWATSGK